MNAIPTTWLSFRPGVTTTNGERNDNMVAWFSKRFTEGETTYQDLFTRERVDGRWAYRLAPDTDR